MKMDSKMFDWIPAPRSESRAGCAGMTIKMFDWIPAFAGMTIKMFDWIPACAGMTIKMFDWIPAPRSESRAGCAGMTIRMFSTKIAPVIFLITISLLISALPAEARWDDPEYHHYDEFLPELIALRDSLKAEGLDYMRIDTIGYSQQEKLPFWSVYISNDVNDTTRDPRPAVIFNGSVHAEEIVGSEYMMWLIRKITTTRSGRTWRSKVDIYIIPLSNPEGLNVVYSLDNTYRKNKRDNFGDGMFRYKIGWGSDSSGVDINRNFPVFWNHGKSLLISGDTEFNDYYRGPSPGSESETRALIDLYDRVRPVYSLTLHSSRTGNFSEKVIYPFGYGLGNIVKQAPDQLFLDEWANQVAARCKRYYDESASYEPNRIGNARGDSETYYYYTFGTFAMRVEIGQKEGAMQPDSAGIYKTINDVTRGFELLLHSAAGETNDGDEIIAGRLDIRVRDSITEEPLYARLKLDSLSTPLIPHRYTSPRTGYYYWPVMSNYVDTLTISRFGYRTRKMAIFGGNTPSSVGGRQNGVLLDPLPWYTARLNVTDTEETPIMDPVELMIDHSDTTMQALIIDGAKEISLPEGEYKLTFFDGVRHVPRIIDFTLSSDTTLTVGLSKAAVLLGQDFDHSDVIHTSDDDLNSSLDSLTRWELTAEVYHSPPRCLTDSRRRTTPKFEDCWDAPYNMIDQSFDLSTAETAMLVYWLNQALEPGHDSMWVEVSTGGPAGSDPSSWNWVQVYPAHQELAILNWREMDSYANMPWNSNKPNLMVYNDWERFIVSLDSFAGESVVHFRFRLRTDWFIEEDGVYIDDVYLLSSGEAPPVITSEEPIPQRFRLGDPYPNPFNGRLSVHVHLPGDSQLNISIFDIHGRKAVSGLGGQFTAGTHQLSIDASQLSTGLYFLRAESAGQVNTRKVMLLK